MIGPGREILYGRLRLQSQTDVVCTNAGQYYVIDGTFLDGISKGFSKGNNKLIYNGPSGAVYNFTGASDVRTDQASLLTYGLFINDELVDGAETPHRFIDADKTSNMSITDIVRLNQGDEIEVRCKTDTAGAGYRVRTLGIVFWS